MGSKSVPKPKPMAPINTGPTAEEIAAKQEAERKALAQERSRHGALSANVVGSDSEKLFGGAKTKRATVLGIG